MTIIEKPDAPLTIKQEIIHPISRDQAGQFKRYTQIFAGVLASLHPTCVLKGRKRVDVVAKACGYTSYGHICSEANDYKEIASIRIFDDEFSESTTKTISEETGFEYDVIQEAVFETKKIISLLG